MMEQHFGLRKLKMDFTLFLTLPGDDSSHPIFAAKRAVNEFFI
jgi:hypothetical protein